MLESLQYRWQRVLNLLTLKRFHSIPFDLRSDSDNGRYVATVRRAVSKDTAFKKFKRDPAYTEILEHVGKDLGLEYLAHIIERDNLTCSDIQSFRVNDLIGAPFIHQFTHGAFRVDCSGTTLRYCSVLSDLLHFFDLRDVRHVIELGVGYGGQAFLYTLHNPSVSYTLVDLPEVLELSRKYLNCHSHLIRAKVEFKSILEFGPETESDLFISNYAFCELPRPLQDRVIEKVMKGSKRGYLIMGGHSVGRVTKADLLEINPTAVILPEVPSTGRANYIVAWGCK